MPKLHGTKAAAEYMTTELSFPIKPGTLEVYRCMNKGPRYHKRNGRVYYAEEDMREYASRFSSVVETLDSHHAGRGKAA